MTSPHPRCVGILAPLFSLRRTNDLGIGDLGALRELCDWAQANGVGFIQMLPTNETGTDPSPYNAISSVALDPLLLEMNPEAVPGLLGEAVDMVRSSMGSDALHGRLVDYTAVRRAKRLLLELAWNRWQREAPEHERQAFGSFRHTESGWLEPYTMFRYFMDLEAGRETWDTWDERHNTPEKARAVVSEQMARDPRTMGEALGYHAFVQWVAARQWAGARRHADSRGVRLMGDIPIGVSYYSADVFFERENFDLEWSGGAPPETVFKDDPFVQKWGQNWGIPLYQWDTMERGDFAWWRRRIRKLAEVYHLFRIDHVLGFYRIYSFPWRPGRNAEFLPLDHHQAAALTGGRLPGFRPRPDDTHSNKMANLADGNRYLRMIQEAAGSTAVVAEDLGCVPDYVRPHLAELGIPGFKIIHWEEGPDGRVMPGHAYPECSFATYGTHDHEPVPALWERLRAEAAGRQGDHDDHWKARRDLARLADFAGIAHGGHEFPPFSSEVKWRLIEALLASKSRYVALMLTDLFGLTDRFNVPGTTILRNWRIRMPWTIATLGTEPALQHEAQQLHHLAKSAGRA